MSARRALITGASGQLGSDLQELLADDWEVTALAHADLDVTSPEALADRHHHRTRGNQPRDHDPPLTACPDPPPSASAATAAAAR